MLCLSKICDRKKVSEQFELIFDDINGKRSVLKLEGE